MVRVRTAIYSRRRKKRVLKQAKGQFGQRSKRYQQAKRSVVKGLTYAYRDRRVKRRLIKNLWIIRINAACRESGIPYSRFMNGLKKASVGINRKMLADLAVNSPSAFKTLIDLSTEQSAKQPVKSSAKKAGSAK
jgi:large subunit ribosomal protein L20